MHGVASCGSSILRKEISVSRTRKHLPLICFSHLRWDFVYQRPQQLMSRAARDREVIFLEEPVFHESGLPELRMRREGCGVQVAVPALPSRMSADEQSAAQRHMVDQIMSGLGTGGRAALWYYTPMALRFTAHLKAAVRIYDCMDELTAFKFAPPELKDLERILFHRADLMFVGGESLYRAKSSRHADCHLFPSSVDAAHFRRARTVDPASEPVDQRDVPHPRVGFFGVIDERMDLDLVHTLAEARPDIHWMFVGPVVKIDPATLPRADNIHWLGLKSYAQLPDYLGGWDAGLMPFALNDSTRYISPTKTPEFLAAGIPLVSTPITDVVSPYGEAGLVEIAATADECLRKIDLLLRRDSSAWLEAADRHLSRLSWERTWNAMSGLIDAATEGSRSASPAAIEARVRKIAAHV